MIRWFTGIVAAARARLVRRLVRSHVPLPCGRGSSATRDSPAVGSDAMVSAQDPEMSFASGTFGNEIGDRSAEWPGPDVGALEQSQ